MNHKQDTAAMAEGREEATLGVASAPEEKTDAARDGRPLKTARPVAAGLAMKDGFPVMPGRIPLLGHVHKIGQDALSELRKAEAACGPMFWTYFGSKLPVLQILDEEGLAILQNKYTDNSFLREQMPVITGEAMNAFDGPRHRNARRASMDAFSPKGLTRAQVGQFIEETIAKRLNNWAGKDKLAIFPETKDIALEVVFRIMGIETSELSQWRRQYEEFFLGMIPLKVDLPGFPAWRCRKARGWLEEKVGRIVADARARSDRDSMVGAMVFGRDDDGNGMSEVELVHNILGLGFAGSETTAAVMAWSALMLSQHPDVWQRLCEEVVALDRLPHTQDELSRQTPLAEAIFRETMRLYPPAPFEMRKTHTEFDMMGRKVPAGTMVGVSLLHVSRNPERYPEPDRWLPDRWLGVDRALSQVETCQFGGGPHACLGRHVAALEITLFIAMLARELGPKGIAPKLAGKMPPPAYLPFLRPSNKAFLNLTGR